MIFSGGHCAIISPWTISLQLEYQMHAYVYTALLLLAWTQPCFFKPLPSLFLLEMFAQICAVSGLSIHLWNSLRNYTTILCLLKNVTVQTFCISVCAGSDSSWGELVAEAWRILRFMFFHIGDIGDGDFYWKPTSNHCWHLLIPNCSCTWVLVFLSFLLCGSWYPVRSWLERVTDPAHY